MPGSSYPAYLQSGDESLAPRDESMTERSKAVDLLPGKGIGLGRGRPVARRGAEGVFRVFRRQHPRRGPFWGQLVDRSDRGPSCLVQERMNEGLNALVGGRTGQSDQGGHES